MSFDAFLTACTLEEFKQNSIVYWGTYDDDCCEAYLKEDVKFSQAYFRKYYWLHSMIAKRVAGCGQKYQAHSPEHIRYHYLINQAAFVWELTRCLEFYKIVQIYKIFRGLLESKHTW